MLSRLIAVLKTGCSLFKSRRQLTLENLALRQQLAMLKSSVKRPRVSHADRLFWVLFSKYVNGWRSMLYALHPDTVVRWHREGFRRYWAWKSCRQHAGRPTIDIEIRKLIRQMQAANDSTALAELDRAACSTLHISEGSAGQGYCLIILLGRTTR